MNAHPDKRPAQGSHAASDSADVGANDSATPRPAGSVRLTWLAAGLLGLEAAGVLGLAAVLGVELVRTTPDSLPGTIFLIVLAVALGAALAVCTAGILGRRSWVRGPVVTWQLIQGGVAMRLTAADAWWFGLPLLMIALIIGVLVAGPWILEPRDRPPG